ncbi:MULTISPECIES: DJ-1/PfpI family protein [unclassified Sphingopyxis]|uniref:DJ-1/PfpI family protein n=1 Tax=unclassified Sphingopyxis TaxID=2614943 RepID=UPI00285C7A78|nr:MULTISPECIES: DJ-1/PfpI family protein [unclassified Sphingopyxis]MDR6834429.1 cyclohexyl-isocyanide hydratase [Sphingopyxis sp. BE122]MDR7226698.1 cyclohexyl-isocyanide hydratase [Sphingopyxis sp. BE259]
MTDSTTTTTTTTTIVFLLFPGITQLDFTAPAQALCRMPGARLVGAAASRDPITTDCGFAILPTDDFASCPGADILCIPGGHGVAEALNDPATIAFIAQQAAGARWVTSVCTGAFLLGRAGLLTGKRATTHWAYAHLLPLVGAEPVSARIVEDGHLVTSGGVTSGLDFALTLIGRLHGDAVAQAIQLGIEYDPAPPYAGGHPDRTPPAITAGLKTRVYDAAAARIEQALGG